MTRLEYLIETKRLCLAALAAPAKIYPNGKSSHEVDGGLLDQVEDELIDFQALTMGANGEWVLSYTDK